MNMTLLILGVLLILFSTILIVINSTDTSNKYINGEVKEKSYEDISKSRQDILKDVRTNNETVEVENENIKIEEKADLEDEILYKDFTDKEHDKTESSENEVSMTDQIIKMYKVDGLEVNEIAKELKKGIREIDIILKVNKIKN